MKRRRNSEWQSVVFPRQLIVETSQAPASRHILGNTAPSAMAHVQRESPAAQRKKISTPDFTFHGAILAKFGELTAHVSKRKFEHNYETDTKDGARRSRLKNGVKFF